MTDQMKEIRRCAEIGNVVPSATVLELLTMIDERGKRIEELENSDDIKRLQASLDVAAGFGRDWEVRARKAEKQLDQVREAITTKGLCEADWCGKSGEGSKCLYCTLQAILENDDDF